MKSRATGARMEKRVHGGHRAGR